MSLWSRFVEAVRSCLPVFPAWASADRTSRSDGFVMSTASTKEEEVKRPLSKEERLERLKKAFAEEYFCSGRPPMEVTGSKMMECGCEPGRHGPLSITEGGQLFYPV